MRFNRTKLSMQLFLFNELLVFGFYNTSDITTHIIVYNITKIKHNIIDKQSYEKYLIL